MVETNIKNKKQMRWYICPGTEQLRKCRLHYGDSLWHEETHGLSDREGEGSGRVGEGVEGVGG